MSFVPNTQREELWYLRGVEAGSRGMWRPKQVYVAAATTLVVGLFFGIFIGLVI